MQHQTVEPGTVLAGRYRVEDLLSDTEGARCWRAVDEVLARSVAVHVLPVADPRAMPLLEAARRSSMVPDGRFVRVLDAAQEAGSVYVVREWIAGEPLSVTLANGPLAPRRAAWIVRECAAAVAAAHDVGIPHLRLVPANVILTGTGGVKVLGLATDAALNALASIDPQADDVRDLGRLLYACLVGRWPGSSDEGLPEAPQDAGRLLRPRQVRAGVPRVLDDVCERILGRPLRNPADALHTAAQVDAALTDALSALADPAATVADGGPALGVPAGAVSSDPDTTAVLPRPPPAASTSPPGSQRDATPVADPLPVVRTPPEPVDWEEDAAPPARSPRSRALAWAAVAALFLGAAVLAYEIGRRGGDEPTGAATPTTPGSTQTGSPPAVRPLAIAAVTDFDPVADGGSGEENADDAQLAVDGDPTTAWETVEYRNNPALGGLKPGVGLLVDLGQPVRVDSVKLTLIGNGTDVELRAAPGARSAPTTADGFETIARESQAGEQVGLRPRRPVTTRYLLVYLTSLPEESPARYRGRIAEVDVFG